MTLPTAMFAADKAMILADWGASVTILHKATGISQTLNAIKSGIANSDTLEMAGVTAEAMVSFSFASSGITGSLQPGDTITSGGIVYRVLNVSVSTSGASTTATCEELSA